MTVKEVRQKLKEEKTEWVVPERRVAKYVKRNGEVTDLGGGVASPSASPAAPAKRINGFLGKLFASKESNNSNTQAGSSGATANTQSTAPLSRGASPDAASPGEQEALKDISPKNTFDQDDEEEDDSSNQSGSKPVTSNATNQAAMESFNNNNDYSSPVTVMATNQSIKSPDNDYSKPPAIITTTTNHSISESPSVYHSTCSIESDGPPRPSPPGHVQKASYDHQNSAPYVDTSSRPPSEVEEFGDCNEDGIVGSGIPNAGDIFRASSSTKGNEVEESSGEQDEVPQVQPVEDQVAKGKEKEDKIPVLEAKAAEHQDATTKNRALDFQSSEEGEAEKHAEEVAEAKLENASADPKAEVEKVVQDYLGASQRSEEGEAEKIRQMRAKREKAREDAKTELEKAMQDLRHSKSSEEGEVEKLRQRIADLEGAQEVTQAKLDKARADAKVELEKAMQDLRDSKRAEEAEAEKLRQRIADLERAQEVAQAKLEKARADAKVELEIAMQNVRDSKSLEEGEVEKLRQRMADLERAQEVTQARLDKARADTKVELEMAMQNLRDSKSSEDSEAEKLCQRIADLERAQEVAQAKLEKARADAKVELEKAMQDLGDSKSSGEVEVGRLYQRIADLERAQEVAQAKLEQARADAKVELEMAVQDLSGPKSCDPRSLEEGEAEKLFQRIAHLEHAQEVTQAKLEKARADAKVELEMAMQDLRDSKRPEAGEVQKLRQTVAELHHAQEGAKAMLEKARGDAKVELEKAMQDLRNSKRSEANHNVAPNAEDDSGSALWEGNEEVEEISIDEGDDDEDKGPPEVEEVSIDEGDAEEEKEGNDKGLLKVEVSIGGEEEEEDEMCLVDSDLPKGVKTRLAQGAAEGNEALVQLEKARTAAKTEYDQVFRITYDDDNDGKRDAPCLPFSCMILHYAIFGSMPGWYHRHYHDHSLAPCLEDGSTNLELEMVEVSDEDDNDGKSEEPCLPFAFMILHYAIFGSMPGWYHRQSSDHSVAPCLEDDFTNLELEKNEGANQDNNDVKSDEPCLPLAFMILHYAIFGSMPGWYHRPSSNHSVAPYLEDDSSMAVREVEENIEVSIDNNTGDDVVEVDSNIPKVVNSPMPPIAAEGDEALAQLEKARAEAKIELEHVFERAYHHSDDNDCKRDAPCLPFSCMILHYAIFGSMPGWYHRHYLDHSVDPRLEDGSTNLELEKVEVSNEDDNDGKRDAPCLPFSCMILHYAIFGSMPGWYHRHYHDRSVAPCLEDGFTNLELERVEGANEDDNDGKSDEPCLPFAFMILHYAIFGSMPGWYHRPSSNHGVAPYLEDDSNKTLRELEEKVEVSIDNNTGEDVVEVDSDVPEVVNAPLAPVAAEGDEALAQLEKAGAEAKIELQQVFERAYDHRDDNDDTRDAPCLPFSFMILHYAIFGSMPGWYHRHYHNHSVDPCLEDGSTNLELEKVEVSKEYDKDDTRDAPCLPFSFMILHYAIFGSMPGWYHRHYLDHSVAPCLEDGSTNLELEKVEVANDDDNDGKSDEPCLPFAFMILHNAIFGSMPGWYHRPSTNHSVAPCLENDSSKAMREVEENIEVSIDNNTDDDAVELDSDVPKAPLAPIATEGNEALAQHEKARAEAKTELEQVFERAYDHSDGNDGKRDAPCLPFSCMILHYAIFGSMPGWYHRHYLDHSVAPCLEDGSTNLELEKVEVSNEDDNDGERDAPCLPFSCMILHYAIFGSMPGWYHRHYHDHSVAPCLEDGSTNLELEKVEGANEDDNDVKRDAPCLPFSCMILHYAIFGSMPGWYHRHYHDHSVAPYLENDSSKAVREVEETVEVSIGKDAAPNGADDKELVDSCVPKAVDTPDAPISTEDEELEESPKKDEVPQDEPVEGEAKAVDTPDAPISTIDEELEESPPSKKVEVPQDEPVGDEAANDEVTNNDVSASEGLVVARDAVETLDVVEVLEHVDATATKSIALGSKNADENEAETLRQRIAELERAEESEVGKLCQRMAELEHALEVAQPRQSLRKQEQVPKLSLKRLLRMPTKMTTMAKGMSDVFLLLA